MATNSPWVPHRDGDGLALVCGHRGASAIEPENTVAAAQAAQDADATWIEFDVRPASDDLVVHHDPTTSSGISIAETPAASLEAPSFATFVQACGPLGLDIELKTDKIAMSNERFVELVAEQIDSHCGGRAADQVIVTSFDHDALDLYRERKPDVATGMLFHEPRASNRVIEHAVEFGHTAIVPWFRLVNRRTVDRAHESGLGVATWTVNADRHIRAMIRVGVDMIIGDDPRRIRSIVDGED